MNIIEDLNKFLEDMQELARKFRECYTTNNYGENHSQLVELLSINNLHLTELLMMKNFFINFEGLSSAEIVRNKQYIKQLDEHITIFRLFNSSCTAILRAITLSEKYKSETSELKVIQKSGFGILYLDEIQDHYMILHKRSGTLEKIDKPYLTRQENKRLAENLFSKLKNLEETK